MAKDELFRDALNNINRDILECKYVYIQKHFFAFDDINRDILECK